jgi:glycosyltransferase involved in cell wall biosynthesis
MKLSVVIPVRNETATIAPLMDSLVNQTLPPDEILVVDGGSADDTRDIVARYARKHPNIRLICDPDAFPGRGRNLGAASAANEWLAFTDAGVLPAPDWLAQLSEPLARDPDIDVVYGGWSPVTNTFFKECAAIAYAQVPSKQSHRSFVEARAVFSSIVRRSVWQKVNGFPEDLRSAEDIVFINRIEDGSFRTAYAPDANVDWNMQPNWRRTFSRFVTYSRHNLRAGLWKRWQARALLRYGLLLLGSVAAIALTKWWPIIVAFLFSMMFIARAVIAVRRNRHTYPASIMRNAGRLIMICLLLMVIDAATLLGTLSWLISDKVARVGGGPGRSQP